MYVGFFENQLFYFYYLIIKLELKKSYHNSKIKEEDKVLQVLFWTCLNELMDKSKCVKTKFKGFMIDEAQVDGNVERLGSLTMING